MGWGCPTPIVLLLAQLVLTTTHCMGSGAEWHGHEVSRNRKYFDYFEFQSTYDQGGKVGCFQGMRIKCHAGRSPFQTPQA